MTEHNGPNLNKKEEDKLPTGYEWVPITQWRLGQLEIFTHIPLQRTQIHFRPINTGLTPVQHQQPTLQVHECESTPVPRLQDANVCSSPMAPHQHRGMLEQLQDLNDRLHLVFLSLPSSAKQTLMEHLSATQTAIWTFSKKINLQETPPKPPQEKPLWPEMGSQLTVQLHHLRERLEQISAAAPTHEQKDTLFANDNLEDDHEEPSWHSDCLTLSNMIEGTLLALAGTAKSSSTNPWSGPVPPLTASPGAIKMQQRSLGYQALAEEKKRENRRERARQTLLDAQAELRITSGNQPTQAKEDARFESGPYDPIQHRDDDPH